MFNVMSTGFYWTTATTIATVACLVVVLVAALLFWRYGKAPAQESDWPVPAWEYLKHFNRAVMGAISRDNKPAGANEFIATLMSLAERGFLKTVQNDQQEAVGLMRAGKVLDPELDVVDASAMELLICFAEADGAVSLSSAKQIGEERKDVVTSSYKAWKELVNNEAVKSVSAGKQAIQTQKALLYVGYILAICAALAAYLLTLMTSLPLLIAGGIVITLSLVMRRTIYPERNKTRELARWLDSLETHRDDVPTDEASLELLLEYAVVFGIGDKTATALAESQTVDSVDAVVAKLDFWKKLKKELYTTNE